MASSISSSCMRILSQAKRLDYVLRLMTARHRADHLSPSGPNGAWLRYKKQFITPDNVQNGVVFWNQYQDALNRAWQGKVPPKLSSAMAGGRDLAGGRVMGKTRILDALATRCCLATRADHFSGELKPSC